MSEYEDVPRDFFIRTKRILEQYDDIGDRLGDGYYDVTLAINCFIGLVILPKNHLYTRLDKIVLNERDMPKGVSVLVTDGVHDMPITLKQLLHCMRNGIAHWLDRGDENFQFEFKNNEISRVKLIGGGNIDKEIYEIEITFNLAHQGLKNFINWLTDTIIPYL